MLLPAAQRFALCNTFLLKCTPGLSSTAARAMSSGATPPPDVDRKGTADLTDKYMPDPVDTVCTRSVQVVTPNLFRDFGGKLRFSGQASTVKCYENNPLVRKALEEPGNGRVLVVDGGGSLRCALLGDMLAENGVKNGWSGILVNGCIRDSADIAKMPLGVKALGTHPLKSSKRDPGQRDVPVSFGGVTVSPGDWVYADGDGILVSKEELTL
ncbi:hypothetical protein VOLCADRAFT_120739 [Volvox carteri f. nagariensis]|uniref:4-hydroxy-4-methyl-2-oxoglutarate aldolase n=1 Tax=Volvox carteri f. nagariensis TaxID=3068 RepID=D8TSD5_VOLCA|nr:uncharacterized protein VOLCADRAFT_120739 [Volvox carteri f. nagariensis]EFJ49804.1 hypothetical protein VOLCADRAFT_120739 [Volvox carteri f. nagariensis]|eukprot:XP_002949311.1 hypothetical protein VOLCADRAFT_120739 [Volvox carteri f. nagariensis]